MSFSKEESREIWEQNAAFWDAAMGDASNDFHREAVRPGVTELLRPGPGDYILDAACGNGNYSAYLAEQGAAVLAFDYSEAMVALARKRRRARRAASSSAWPTPRTARVCWRCGGSARSQRRCATWP